MGGSAIYNFCHLYLLGGKHWEAAVVSDYYYGTEGSSRSKEEKPTLLGLGRDGHHKNWRRKECS